VTALLVALALRLAADARDGGAPDAGGRDGGAAPADAGVDPDQEVIDHLDELQDLELLENLELFEEPAAEEKR
jgi:hypothetical protein